MALNQLELPLNAGDSIYDDPAVFNPAAAKRARPRAAVAAGIGVLGLVAVAGLVGSRSETTAPAMVTYTLDHKYVDAQPKNMNSKRQWLADDSSTPAGARTEDLGSSPQSGAYFVTLDIGTPARPFRVVSSQAVRSCL